MGLREDALKLHKDARGKIRVESKVPVRDGADLSLAYSPGVAEPCLEIAKNRDMVDVYTNRGNMIAVVSNGTAVLGLGDIGAYAAMPVMEGKSILFKTFSGVDAFPICLDTSDCDKIIETIKLLEPTFGGINLEDIKAPECFVIEQKLKEICSIPIFHDDQHGTAVVTMAGLINALKLAKKSLSDIKVVTNGAGAAGTAIIKLLLSLGVKEVIMCDRQGIIFEGREAGMNPFKDEIAKMTNRGLLQGGLADALKGADVFLGVSAPHSVTKQMVKSMKHDPIIFAMANPVPEIMPADAKDAGALVIGTGRSDYPNQINNVSAFPGIFRGALDVKATCINDEMKIAAAYAIASLVSDEELTTEYVVPKAFDKRVAPAVACAVAQAAIDSGVAREHKTKEQILEHMKSLGVQL